MKHNMFKRFKKKFISLLLVVSVTVSLFVPFDLTVTAEEEPATGSDICALLYFIDPSKVDNNGITVTQNLELVFQRGDEPDPNKTVFRHFTDFADINPSATGAKENRRPWYREDPVANTGTVFASQIMQVTVKDKIQPKSMSGWFQSMSQLTFDDFHGLENIDVSEVINADYLFISCKKLTNADFTFWTNFPKLQTIGNAFNNCTALTDINISTWNMPVCNYTAGLFSKCSSLEYLDISGLHLQKAKIIGSMFNACTGLKHINLGELNAVADTQLCYLFDGCTSLEEVDLSGWNVPYPGTMMEMFDGCTNLKSINFGSPEHWGTTTRDWTYNGYKERAYEYMFRDCVSLETLDLTCVKGALICSSMFQGCTALKEVDLSNAGLGRNGVEPDLTGKNNIFEGCKELSLVKLSANGWPLSGKAGASIPSKETWAKIEDAAGNKLDGSETLPAAQLFLDFQRDYAGTWVAVDKIVLNANGGKPAYQSIGGAKGLEAEYDEPVTASRAGYQFDDWWTEKDGGSKLEDGRELEAWTYYAHWIENHYNLVLNGNGGTVPEGFSVEGATVSEDRETITFNNISYTQFVDLTSRMFTNEDGSVLASWNIRKNGTSTQFAANDSVNKLSVTQGDTATLYAQWHTPSAVITFDSQGGSAIEKKDCEIGDRYGTLSIPFKGPDEANHAGYTFIGWFTEPNGQGYKIVDKADDDPTFDNTKEQNKVTGSRTLYACWMPNCTVTFDANSGTVDGESTVGKICMYNQKLGMLPVPEHGSASFEGWFTEQTEGARVTSETVIDQPAVTYYAHWGYKPKFETDGGSFVTYNADYYHSQDNPEYILPELPTVDKYRCSFLGWFADEDGNGTYEKQVAANTPVDLSYNSTIKAMWEEDAQYIVTLNANGGVIPGGQTEFKYYKDDKISGLPVPIKSGAEFDSWYYGDSRVTEGQTAVTSDMTLNAHWITKNCTVTFDPNGGTLYDPSNATIKVVRGKTIPALPGANKKEEDGTVQHFFGGWYENADGTGSKLEPDTVITGDKIYYAKWVDPKNIVKINDSGTTDMSNTLYMYSVTWGSPSDGSVTNNTGDNLKFHPISNGNISALLRIQFYSYDNNSNTDIKLPPGSVKIKIPKYIFKDRDGNNIGTDNLSVGIPDHAITDNNDIHFYYDTVEENGEFFYVITNSVELTGKHDDFEIFYQADPNKIAGGYIDENGYFRYKGDDTATEEDDEKYYSKSFDVNIKVDLDRDGNFTEEKELDYTKPLSLDVHTRVNTAVQKIQTDVSMKWKSEWGAEPADSDEYYYVTWNLVSTHSSSTQPFTLLWSEDTVRDGAIVIPPKDESGVERKNGSYATKVVTKHRKDTVHKTENGWANAHNEAELEVTWKSGYKQHFRANADAYAYIEEAGAIGGNNSTFFYKRINGNSDEKDAHYIQGGQEQVQVDETIRLVYDIFYKETKRDTAPVWNAATGTYTTPKRTMTIEDGAPGDLVISPYSKTPLPSESDWNSAADVNLSQNDYYFDKLDIRVTEYDAIKMNKIWSNPFAHENVADYSDDGIVISIRRAGRTEIENLMPIVHSAGTTVDLPDDTVWFRVSYSSSFYTTDFQVKPTLCLKPTNHVKSLVQDHIEANKDTMIKNRCRLTYTEGNSAPVVTESGANGTSGWPCAYVLNIGESKLYASKSCCSQSKVTLDNHSASESMAAVISGWGYNTTGNKKPMKSASFYDLIPEGYVVNTGSVFVVPRTENTSGSDAKADNYASISDSSKLPSAFWSVSFSDNWNDCGRTLMTVDVNIPDDIIATGVDVYYLLNTTYANIIANGATPNNIFAYKDTTPGQSVPVERTKTLTEIEAKFRPSLAFADSSQTAFNQANINAQIPSVISSGLSSTVRTEGATQSNHQIIGRNTDYSYSISYTSDATYSGENLVLYDLIERQIGSDRSEWKGSFRSIDVSAITKVKNKTTDGGYCAPVVYYSTHENFTEDQLDVDNAEIWTTTMPPKDQITAVAVDCRKSTNNKNFILDIKKCLSFDINMHSPIDADNNTTAYNEAYVRGFLSGISTPVDNITQTRVIVRFTVPNFVKDAFPASGTIDNPESVVKNSVLEYVLRLTNPDEDVPMENVTVEDILCDKVRLVNAMTVKINDEAPVSIDKAAGITYEIAAVDSGTKFTAVVSSLAPGETVEITIPVTVIGETGDTLTNTANILSVNGVSFDAPVDSNPTYHVISDTQVKVLKTNSKGKPLAGAELQILDKDKEILTLTNDNGDQITSFTSTEEIIRFQINPGNYYLRELSAPAAFDTYSGDLAFRIDSEGIIYVDNRPVSYVEMRDQPHYKVIFYENNPEIDDKNVVFRTYEPNELNDDKSITHFYDIPKWAGDEYVFAGWHHNDTYTKMTTPDNVSVSPSDFEHDTYSVANPNGGSDPDYHLYAKWIKVGTVAKASEDTNITDGYRGFGLAGVQLRPGTSADETWYDPNIRDKDQQNPDFDDDQYNDSAVTTPEGMRFVTSMSERLLGEINGIGKIANTPAVGKTFGVEYGYVVGTESNINAFTDHYKIVDKTAYTLQYRGENVNGVNTTGSDVSARSAQTDYRYITNVDCTSREGDNNNNPGVVKWDHRNFADYRLYTLVVTYEDSQDQLDQKLDARAYIRYYDANGKLRVFYNTYRQNTYYGGCMCSFNQISAMALPAQPVNH